MACGQGPVTRGVRTGAVRVSLKVEATGRPEQGHDMALAGPLWLLREKWGSSSGTGVPALRPRGM